MSKQIRIEFISDGFRQILQGSETRSLVEKHATEIQRKTDADANVDIISGGYGGGRWVGFVSVSGRDQEALERAVR
jgi:hypothetical protein